MMKHLVQRTIPNNTKQSLQVQGLVRRSRCSKAGCVERASSWPVGNEIYTRLRFVRSIWVSDQRCQLAQIKMKNKMFIVYIQFVKSRHKLKYDRCIFQAVSICITLFCHFTMCVGATYAVIITQVHVPLVIPSSWAFFLVSQPPFYHRSVPVVAQYHARKNTRITTR